MRRRGNLPKVPACTDCNNRKSKYERYAMAVFPFGAMDDAGKEMLETKVKDRLRKDQRLWRQLRDGRGGTVVVNPDGTADTTFRIPFDDEQASNLFGMIIRGLVWHHCRSPIPSSYVVRLFYLTEFRLSLFKQQIISRSPEQFQEISLADGAFYYQFTQSADDPFFTAWVLDVYNSLNMCSISGDGRLLRVHVAALTGPQEMNRIADAIEAMAVQQGTPGDASKPRA